MKRNTRQRICPRRLDPRARPFSISFALSNGHCTRSCDGVLTGLFTASRGLASVGVMSFSHAVDVFNALQILGVVLCSVAILVLMAALFVAFPVTKYLGIVGGSLFLAYAVCQLIAFAMIIEI